VFRLVCPFFVTEWIEDRKVTRIVEKLADLVDRRSPRELQSPLLKIKQQYRLPKERYTHTHGVNSYINEVPAR
jgi:hypothetical protein